MPTSQEFKKPFPMTLNFFFFPIAAVYELISMGKCPEMDIVLDLWVHAIYNDGQVQGSEPGNQQRAVHPEDFFPRFFVP